MSGVKSSEHLQEAFRDWAEWESSHGIHAPENILSGENSQGDELRYAVHRLSKEVEEASEVAEELERFESGEADEIEQGVFDYTDKVEGEYENDYEKAMEELGMELADIGLFALKIDSCLNTGRMKGLEPDYKRFAEVIEASSRKGTEVSYTQALRGVQEVVDPDIDGSPVGEAAYLNEMTDVDQEQISLWTEKIFSALGTLTERLPRNLSDYMMEKIEYDQDRNLENMDADYLQVPEEFYR